MEMSLTLNNMNSYKSIQSKGKEMGTTCATGDDDPFKVIMERMNISIREMSLMKRKEDITPLPNVECP